MYEEVWKSIKQSETTIGNYKNESFGVLEKIRFFTQGKFWFEGSADLPAGRFAGGWREYIGQLGKPLGWSVGWFVGPRTAGSHQLVTCPLAKGTLAT